jgi:outer membrane protein
MIYVGGEERRLLPPFYGERMKTGSVVRGVSIGAAVVVLTLGAAVHVWGQEQELGVVDMARVIDESKQGKKAIEEIAAKLKAAKNDLEKREKEIIGLKQEIEKNAMVLTSDALAQKERRYQDELIDYQRKLEEYQYQLTAKNKEINNTMLSLTKQVVEDIGSGRYLLILEKTASGVLYHTDAVDLTDEVIGRLSKK